MKNKKTDWVTINVNTYIFCISIVICFIIVMSTIGFGKIMLFISIPVLLCVILLPFIFRHIMNKKINKRVYIRETKEYLDNLEQIIKTIYNKKIQILEKSVSLLQRRFNMLKQHIIKNYTSGISSEGKNKDIYPHVV